MRAISEARIRALRQREEARYIAERPKSKELFERARKSLIGGVPVGWQRRWVEPFPIYVREAKGSHLIDVDGHRYVDISLGDSGALYGHSPEATVKAMVNQLHKGLTFGLPTEDAIWVGEELARRFGLPYWQVYMTATDANKFAIRIARAVTGRDMVLVFHGCYHGSVEETQVTLRDGRVVPDNLSVPWRLPDPSRRTRVIEFNDVESLEKALSPGDVACVLCEPAMTNVHVGIIYAEPGYHHALRELTRRYGTLLILDEVHTIAAGPGGLTREMGLTPDMLVLGKPIAGGMPAAAVGFSQKVVDKFMEIEDWREIGGTLSGNALALAALRATLEHVMTESAYEHMISLAKRVAEASNRTIRDAGMPWCVTRLGCRIEYCFQPAPPKNGADSDRIHEVNTELGKLFHIYMMTHGVLMTPFHNVVLTSPATTIEDVDFYNGVFGEFVKELIQ